MKKTKEELGKIIFNFFLSQYQKFKNNSNYNCYHPKYSMK